MYHSRGFTSLLEPHCFDLQLLGLGETSRRPGLASGRYLFDLMTDFNLTIVALSRACLSSWTATQQSKHGSLDWACCICKHQQFT